MESLSNEPDKPAKPVGKPYRPYTSWQDRKAAWAAIPPDKPLSKRERVFIAEYAKDMNASAALQRAGWAKAKRIDLLASRLMKRANVAKAAEAVALAREKESEVSIDRIVKAYSEFAFSEHIGPILPSHRLAALDSLAKWKRMFQPENQVTIPVTFQFIGAPDLPPDSSNTLESAVKTIEAPLFPLGKPPA